MYIVLESHIEVAKVNKFMIIKYMLVLMLELYLTRGSAITEGPRDAVVSRNSVTTKHPI